MKVEYRIKEFTQLIEDGVRVTNWNVAKFVNGIGVKSVALCPTQGDAETVREALEMHNAYISEYPPSDATSDAHGSPEAVRSTA